MEELLVERRAGVARLTLNRPQAKNALNTALLRGLAATFDELAEDRACRAVLLSGAQGHFAAGADIGEIEHKTSAEAAADPRKAAWERIRAFPKPVIAAVDGFCLGGGFELALLADLIVAGETARFGLPESNLGLIPGAGGGQRLMARVGQARASRLLLTGEIIDAGTAFAWGIAAYQPSGSALPEAEKRAEGLAARAPLALAAAKRALVHGAENPAALALERSLFEALLDTADKREGIAAFRARRTAEFTGE